MDDDDREDLLAHMDELTKGIVTEFKKLTNVVYESLRSRVEHSSVVLTLSKDDVMVFDDDDRLNEAKNMLDVFKALLPHCSYFNYDLLKLVVEVHGSKEDRKHMGEYLQSFTKYCEAMPCAEEVYGNEDSRSKRIKIKFKVNFDRHQLKVDSLRRVKNNIARHLRVNTSSLYLRKIEEGCVLLEFLVPRFLFERIFPLNEDQMASLCKDVNVISIQCDDPSLHVVSTENNMHL